MGAFRTSLLRSIRDSLGRFLAIAAIVALGCGFYGGLRMTGEDMRTAADRFYDGTHLYDIRLISTLGYSDSQLKEIARVEGVSAIMPVKSTDVMGQINEEQYAMRVSSIPIASLEKSTCDDGCNVISDDANYLNRLIIEEGRWPQRPGECVISADRVAGVPVEMGDRVEVLYGSQDLDGVLKTRTFTIVGTAHASTFVSSVTMGPTSLGNGSIQQFAYVSELDFDADCPYTEVFLEVEGAAELYSGSDEYEALVEEVTSRFDAIAPSLARTRLEDVKREAQDELDEEKEIFEKEKSDALRELADAEQELIDAYKKLADAEQELIDGRKQIEDAEKEISSGRDKISSGLNDINSGYKELESQSASAQDKLDQAYRELIDNQNTINASRDELESKRAEVSQWPTQRTQLESQLAEARAGLTQAQDGAAQAQAALDQLAPLAEQVAQLPPDDPTRIEVEAQIAAAQEGLATAQSTIGTLTSAIAQLEDGIAKGDAGVEEFARGERELAAAQEQIDAGWSEYYAQANQATTQLTEAQDTLTNSQADINNAEQELADAQAELDDAKAKLADGEKEYADGKKEYEEGREEYAEKSADALKEIADAEREIHDAQQEIDEIELPDIYVLDRTKNYGVQSQVADSERIDNIGRIFPFVFFLVAALVALTTMTRMVDEERTLIGTYKALGYSRARITARYLIYAGVASIVGAIVGLALLSQLLPYVIAKAYAIIYNIPDYPLPLPFDWPLGLLSGGMGVGITLLATLAAVLATLREQPARLMLPRTPRAGKRILLERITPLWHRVSFSWKVTLRNLFRYKKRLFMTIFGIAGCTALLLTGWGLHDAIWDIIDKQYGPVINYNIITKLESDATEEQMAAAENYMSEVGETENITRVQSSNMQIGSETHDVLGVELVVPEVADEFKNLLHMKNRFTQEPLDFDDDSVILTEKLARTLGVDVGDEVKIYEQDDIGNALGAGYAFKVTGIMENYIGNWAYLGRNAYKDSTGDSCSFKTLYGYCTEGIDERITFTDGLHDLEGVQTVTYNDETIDRYRTMLSSVDMIVVVLVVSAAALAFIVLYNLTNININERRREIASLKVLGFTKHEVGAYIFREIAIITVIAALFGLVLGTFLESFVCVTAEVDYVMFGREIHLSSFVISFVMTLIFAAIAMLFMRGKLAEVDMVESLKSVD